MFIRTVGSSYATPLRPFKLLCIVKKARGMHINATVRFLLHSIHPKIPHTKISTYAVGLVQLLSSCAWEYTDNNYKHGYKAECKFGTQVYRAKQRRYTLTIFRPSIVERMTAYCDVHHMRGTYNMHVYSSYVEVEFIRKFTALTHINVIKGA